MLKHRIDRRRRAYLDAMGISTWVLRDAGKVAAEASEREPLLKLGPGAGQTLLICANAADSAGKLANDISRTLASAPVWGWPVGGDCELVTLPVVLAEHLFTTVAIFGKDLAARFFGSGMPDSLQSAKLVQLPAIQSLANDPRARRSLWLSLCRSGLVNGH